MPMFEKRKMLPMRPQVTTARSVPRQVDSVEKLVDRLALMAKVPVIYNGKRLRPAAPTHIFLSPSLLRAFHCHLGCTACCLPITLDFTEEEFRKLHWSDDIEQAARLRFRPRRVVVNGYPYTIMSYPQYKDPACPFLRPTRPGGALGCGFWTANNATQPLECSSAPQLLMTTRGVGMTMITKHIFTRGFKWKVPPQCEFAPTITSVDDLARAVDLKDEIALLHRYQYWADFLHIPTHLPAIITAMQHLKETVEKQGAHLVQVV